MDIVRENIIFQQPYYHDSFMCHTYSIIIRWSQSGVRSALALMEYRDVVSWEHSQNSSMSRQTPSSQAIERGTGKGKRKNSFLVAWCFLIRPEWITISQVNAGINSPFLIRCWQVLSKSDKKKKEKTWLPTPKGGKALFAWPAECTIILERTVQWSLIQTIIYKYEPNNTRFWKCSTPFSGVINSKAWLNTSQKSVPSFWRAVSFLTIAWNLRSRNVVQSIRRQYHGQPGVGSTTNGSSH